MTGRGVKLEQNNKEILKRGILAMPAPEGLPEPSGFSVGKGEPGSRRILRAAEDGGIYDEFCGTPLRELLESLSEKKPQVLVARCFDDDPYACASQAVLRELPEKVTDGLALAAKACGATETLVTAASRSELHLFKSHKIAQPAAAAGTRTPVDFFLLRQLGRSGKTAAILGAQACAALSDAVRYGKPQAETVVTVFGDAMEKCANFRVHIGAPLSSLLEFCGAQPRAEFVSVGSALTGYTVRSLNLPVSASTRCVTVMKKAPKQPTFACMRCGRCEQTCPVGIIPWLVHRELEADTPEPLLLFHVGDCIGCRVCSAVCPSGIGLEEEVRRAALMKGGHDA
ncbi:MAG TPA: 4Fe-4S dicluster domain-containing protein [Armatimonadota bacterium]|nr:4Fe-4S dicluster domain-containing protein [Armatimonadota bacterium]